jgi:pyruvate, water dikinase
MEAFIKKFSQTNIQDIPAVGGKNASLGEMIANLSSRGIRVPDGFATTAAAFWDFVDFNKLRGKLEELIRQLDKSNYSNLAVIGTEARQLLLNAVLPGPLKDAILQEYCAVELIPKLLFAAALPQKTCHRQALQDSMNLI